jgi:uncharacterized membrane protein
MTLCALSKQPQIVFVLLESMVSRYKYFRRRWSHAVIVVLPCLVLSPLWVLAVSADIAAWRLQEEGYHPPEHFDPLWKLHYMWEHPLHFPLAAWTAFSGWTDQLWRELIGVLGWQDIPLPAWTYFLLTVFLVLVPFQRLQMDSTARLQVALTSGLTVLAYVVLVYLIFFLTIRRSTSTMYAAFRDAISLWFFPSPRSSSPLPSTANCPKARPPRLQLLARRSQALPASVRCSRRTGRSSHRRAHRQFTRN